MKLILLILFLFFSGLVLRAQSQFFKFAPFDPAFGRLSSTYEYNFWRNTSIVFTTQIAGADRIMRVGQGLNYRVTVPNPTSNIESYTEGGSVELSFRQYILRKKNSNSWGYIQLGGMFGEYLFTKVAVPETFGLEPSIITRRFILRTLTYRVGVQIVSKKGVVFDLGIGTKRAALLLNFYLGYNF